MAPRSRAELERKLAQKGCPDEVAAVVLDRLAEVGLLDDVAYAAMLVRSKQSSRGLARSALARELATKGVDRDIASDALEDIDEVAERARAEDLVAKRLRAMTGLSAQVQARRLSAMLARKGYPGGLAYAVIQAAIADLPEHQRD
jgi:regulatory protein